MRWNNGFIESTWPYSVQHRGWIRCVTTPSQSIIITGKKQSTKRVWKASVVNNTKAIWYIIHSFITGGFTWPWWLCPLRLKPRLVWTWTWTDVDTRGRGRTVWSHRTSGRCWGSPDMGQNNYNKASWRTTQLPTGRGGSRKNSWGEPEQLASPSLPVTHLHGHSACVVHVRHAEHVTSTGWRVRAPP